MSARTTATGVALAAALLPLTLASPALAAPSVTLEGPTSVVEGSVYTATVEVTNPDVADAFVCVSVSPGTAQQAVDYTDMGETCVAVPSGGSRSIPVSVGTNDDNSTEPVETFSIDVTDETVEIVPLSSYAISIVDNDTLTVGDTSDTEGGVDEAGELTFIATRSNTTNAETISYTIKDGDTPGGDETAEPQDYTPPAVQTFSFVAGQTAATTTIDIVDDMVHEDAETLRVRVETGATAVGTINDNDAQPLVTVEDTEAAESDGDGTAGTLSFPVTLAAVAEREVMVSYSIVVETATKRGDFAVPDDRTVTFVPGETRKTIEIDILDDETEEPNETVGIRINDAGSDTAQGTILDDDSTPVITIGDVRQAEGTSSGDDNELLLQRRANGWFNGTAFRFPVRLSAPSGKTVTVQYSTVDGTATSPSDFVAANGETLTFAPGQTEQEVFVEVMADSLVESTETFTVELTAPVNTVIGDGSGLGIIENDDRVASEPQPAPPVEEPSASPSATAPVTASPSATATASATPTATTSAAPTASAAPSPTGSVTPPPAVTCANPVGFTLNRDFIVPGIPVTATITGPAGAVVAIQAYSRPSTDYRQVRSTTIPGNGQVSFDLVPGTNTRLFAECVDQPGSVSAQRVINVRTALSLTVVRNGTRDYTFQGRILPRRADQLITLYRVTDRGARVLTSQLKTDDTGTYRIDRTFSGSGTFGFLTRTGQTLTNNAGESNTPTTVAGIRSGRGVPRPTAIF